MKSRTLIAISILVFIVAAAGLHRTPFISSSRAAAWGAWVQATGNILPLRARKDSEGLSARIESLQAENIRLQAELADYARLREQLGTPSFTGMDVVQAAVAGRPIDTFRSQYVITKGGRDGIVADAPVTIHGSVLIGFVETVHDRSATIRLLLHPDTHITAETVSTEKNNNPARGLLQSRHYTSLFLRTVPRDAELHEGQNVVTVGKDSQIPPGLLIGRVKTIDNQEHEAYQQARLELVYDPDTIDAVNVLIPR